MIPGIHHVTAIVGDPQENLDFWGDVLGLRLVKRTVNFDDPGTYHLYYGDELGRPGTIMTFFPSPRRAAGRRGAGQVTVTSFSVPAGSLGFWRERLAAAGVDVGAPQARFEEEALEFLDPHGLKIELVAHEGAPLVEPWESGPVPEPQAVRGLYAVTLAVGSPEDTGELLVAGLGMRAAGEQAGRRRYRMKGDRPGTLVDVIGVPGGEKGKVAVGTVHHVAFRAATDDDQLVLQTAMRERGLRVTEVLDRNYFRSIYFREPGGVLFEIATDAPGFAVDEQPAELGRALKLPGWLEPRRAELEAQLPPINHD